MLQISILQKPINTLLSLSVNDDTTYTMKWQEQETATLLHRLPRFYTYMYVVLLRIVYSCVNQKPILSLDMFEFRIKQTLHRTALTFGYIRH